MIRLNCFFQAADAAKYKDALRAAVATTSRTITTRWPMPKPAQ